MTRLREVAAAYQPLEVYLFGSRAGEAYVESSDWDLFVVSPSFDGVPFLRRGADLAWDLAQANVGALDVLCYTPAEAARLRESPTGLGAALQAARRLW